MVTASATSKPVKVLLVGNYVHDRQFSMLQFVRILEEALPADGIEVKVLSPMPRMGNLWPGKKHLGKWLGYFDKYVLFPRKLSSVVQDMVARNEPAVVHICDQGNAIYTRYCQQVPVLVTCHDLMAIMKALGRMAGDRTKWTGRQYQRMIFAGLQGGHYFVCDSNNTSADLGQLLPEVAKRQRVIYPQLAHPYRVMPSAERDPMLVQMGLDPRQSFILNVGDNQWYKNRAAVLRMFRHLRERPHARENLVFVGSGLSPDHKSYAVRVGIDRRITVLSNLSSEYLNALYSAATLFLFPSLYEGFGWPPIEAQASGCPVVASNGGSLREILLDSALVSDPTDEARMLADTTQLIRSPETRQEVIAAGLRNAARFAPPNMTSRYAGLYRELVAR